METTGITPDEPTEPTEPPEDVEEEVIDEEETPDPALPELDIDKLISVACKRFDRMVERGRKDVGSTFAAQVLTLVQSEDEKLAAVIEDMEAQSRTVVDAAIRALANERVEAADDRGIGDIARRHLLAVLVQNGDFNK
jgi:hypothetical protein